MATGLLPGCDKSKRVESEFCGRMVAELWVGPRQTLKSDEETKEKRQRDTGEKGKREREHNAAVEWSWDRYEAAYKDDSDLAAEVATHGPRKHDEPLPAERAPAGSATAATKHLELLRCVDNISSCRQCIVVNRRGYNAGEEPGRPASKATRDGGQWRLGKACCEGGVCYRQILCRGWRGREAGYAAQPLT